MTRKEAVSLEKEVDKKFSKALGEDCKCSLNLAGKFRISFNNNLICMRPDNGYIAWIKYEGSYATLSEYLNKIEECRIDNRDLIDKLVWSYEHIKELED